MLSWFWLVGAQAFGTTATVQGDDVQLAESLKTTYPNAEVAIKECHQTYTFTLSDKDSIPVRGNLHSEESYLALRYNLKMNRSVFYDDMTEVKELKVTDGRNKKVTVFPYYGPYQTGEYFYDDAKLCTFILDFPSKGSLLNCQFDKTYKDLKYLTSVYLPDFYPVVDKTLEFEIPDWLDIELREFNFEGYNIEKQQVRHEDRKSTSYIYKVSNLPEMKDETGAPPLAKVYPHILVLSKRYTQHDQSHDLLANTKDLYKWYASLVAGVKNKPDVLKTTVDILTSGKEKDLDKVEAIFYWVQDNIRYIAFENGIMGFRPENADEVFNNRYGDCKGMANLMKEMLVLAGFDARLTWIGTKDIPYNYSIPSLAVDNHMICTLFLDGKRYFLDGTEEFIGVADYASRIQGRQVMIEDGENFILDTVPEFDKTHNKVSYNASFSVDSNAVLKGHIESQYRGEEKTVIRRSYAAMQNNDKEDALKEFLKGGDKNVQVNNVEATGLSDRSSDLIFHYDARINNHVTQVGNEYYITLDNRQEYGQARFTDKRINDYEFQNKVLIEGKQELHFPASWKIDFLPDPVDIQTDRFAFKLQYRVEGQTIHYKKSISIDEALLRHEDFEAWNQAVDQVNKFYNSQIVLVKP
ncbi:MAG: transglutaminase domain-containing protein [Flavobacteriales bacterium]|nr:transglutaminase domain-containing protein [Flavobacteriales bacterium]MCB9448125.1 transglutaminase domain-containing protein [Flavobacteriales bacterium]